MLNSQICDSILISASPIKMSISILKIRKLRYREVKALAQIMPRFLARTASH